MHMAANPEVIHINKPFTTLDKDNDELSIANNPGLWTGNCALLQGGGFWYKYCGTASLTGTYGSYFQWLFNVGNLRESVMMVR